jgi:hypothetical protein
MNLETLITENYCSVSTMCDRNFCDTCKSNYKKIKYYLEKDNLSLLAEDWNSPFDENIKLNTKRVIRYKKIELDPNWRIKCFNYRFNEDLDNYIEELKDYDVIAFGDFNKSLYPLRKLPNLKGIIGGVWFFSDINELSGLANLKFIYVGNQYHMDLKDDIYNITYNARTSRQPI